MSGDPTIEATIRTLIETQVIQALNSAPEVIEKLIKAALEKPVDRSGNREGERSFSSYGGTMPYLDWLVGDEIRNAARNAVIKIVQEQSPKIEEEVRKGLSSESVVAAVVKSLVGNASNDYRITVNFDAMPRSS